MEAFFIGLLQTLSIPQNGLLTLFLISFIAATLLPVTPTPFLIGLIKLNPELFWPAIGVATLGNTLGGGLNWWIGYGAKNLHDKMRKDVSYGKAMRWLQKFGPRACLFCWLPVVGDPLSVAAGWLRFPFWSCLFYMGAGRFMRFLLMTVVILWIWPGALEF